MILRGREEEGVMMNSDAVGTLHTQRVGVTEWVSTPFLPAGQGTRPDLRQRPGL